MSTTQPYENDQPYVAPNGNMDQPKKSGWFGGCLIGCLVVGGIMVVLCAGVGFYAWKQGPSLMVQGSREVVKVILQDSDLPAEEQDAVMVEFDRAGDAFIAGDLTLQGVGELMQDLVESPVMTFVVLYGVEKKYLENSGLSEEEKQDAKQTMMRLSRGVMEDQLSGAETKQLSRHVMVNPDSDDPSDKKLKDTLTDEELRQFFAEAKELCDQKEIPFEETDMKISDKLREIIDKHLVE